jgi:small subunit ribosomal protein S1
MVDGNDNALSQPEQIVQQVEMAEPEAQTGEGDITTVEEESVAPAEDSLPAEEDMPVDESESLDDDTPVDEVVSPADEEATVEAAAEATAEQVDAEDEPEPVLEEEDEFESALSDEELFLAALEGEMPTSSRDDSDDFMPTVKRGQIIQGTVASITENEILVDVGLKSEGIVTSRDLERLDPEVLEGLSVGDDIHVYVLSREGPDGNIVLSLRRAMEEQDWIDAEAYLNSAETYWSSIEGYNKGGLIVRFGKVRGFVPASQVSRDRQRRSNGSTPDERWAHMVGDEIAVKVIEVDRGRNRLILSERAAEKDIREKRRSELIDTLEVGQIITGDVISLTDFGAFVDLGGADGLIHLSELSWKHVTHPREVLSVGDEVEVEVIHVDKDRQRIGLSRKNRLADPWETLDDTYEPDQLVQGTVTKLTKFGAFARLVDLPEIEGLIHISELADRRVKHPREVVEEGQVVTLRIIRIDSHQRRLGLSLKRVNLEEYADQDWRSMLSSINENSAAEAEPVVEEAAEEPEAFEEEPVDDSVDEEPVAELAEEAIEAEEPADQEPVAELAEEAIEAEEPADQEPVAETAEDEPEAEEPVAALTDEEIETEEPATDDEEEAPVGEPVAEADIDEEA